MGVRVSVVPFRLSEPLAIVSLDGANWRVDLFGYGDCAPLGATMFATIEQAGDHVADLYIEGTRLLFKDWTSGIRDRMSEALQ